MPGQPSGSLVTANPNQKFLARAAGSGDLHLTWFSIPDVEQASLDLKSLLEGADVSEGVVLFDRELPSAEILAVIEGQGCRSLALDLIDQPGLGAAQGGRIWTNCGRSHVSGKTCHIN